MDLVEPAILDPSHFAGVSDLSITRAAEQARQILEIQFPHQLRSVIDCGPDRQASRNEFSIGGLGPGLGGQAHREDRGRLPASVPRLWWRHPTHSLCHRFRRRSGRSSHISVSHSSRRRSRRHAAHCRGPPRRRRCHTDGGARVGNREWELISRSRPAAAGGIGRGRDADQGEGDRRGLGDDHVLQEDVVALLHDLELVVLPAGA